MAEFKDRLEQALNIRNMKPSELSKQTGIGEGAISQYRKGAYKASQRNLEKISKTLNFSIPWLMGITDEQSHLIQSAIPPGLSPMPKTSRVPRIGRIACGQPITAEENIEDYDEVLSSWHADFTLVCVGDSMRPKIEDGDVVAIKRQSEVENGQIAAVRIEGEATLKQVFYRDGYLELRPLNSEYESFIFIGEKMGNVNIEGKAVGLCRNL